MDKKNYLKSWFILKSRKLSIKEIMKIFESIYKNG